MRLSSLAWAGGLVGGGMLVYGALVESKRLVLERHTLRLPHWPDRLKGFRIAVLADLHLLGWLRRHAGLGHAFRPERNLTRLGRRDGQAAQ